MSLRCSIIKFAAALDCRELVARHTAKCPHCRETLESAEQIDALLKQAVSPEPSGRAPGQLIAAVRAAAPEPSPRRVPVAAALVASLLVLVVVAPHEEAPTPASVSIESPPAVEPLPLPSASAGGIDAPAELALVDFESEFALLAADFRRSAGRE
jgi:anti-sigma factor RsiW